MSGVLDSREVLMARSSGLNQEDKLGSRRSALRRGGHRAGRAQTLRSGAGLCAVGQASGKWREGHVLRGWDCRTYG